MIFRILIFITAIGVISSCTSGKKTCTYETRYNEAAKNLNAALSETNTAEIKDKKYASDFFSDIVHLSCSDFQREYKLSDEKLKQEIIDAENATEFLQTYGKTGEYISAPIEFQK